MMRKFLIFLMLSWPCWNTQAAQNGKPQDAEVGDAVNINSMHWLGPLKLKQPRLEAIKAAVEKALRAPVDEHEDCGDPPLGCFARTALKWTDNGVRYREVIVYVHMVGNGGSTVHTVDGHWPKVVIK